MLPQGQLADSHRRTKIGSRMKQCIACTVRRHVEYGEVSMKFRIVAGAMASASIFAIAATAQAQDAAQSNPAAAQPAAATSGGGEVDNGDIVVTARRREERLQDVPISITAVTGDQLTTRGIRDALDLQYQTPSLTVTSNGASRTSVSYSIRGQRTQEVQLLTDPPVGTYFAEVVMPRTYGFGTAFYDLKDIQVLKGVQGTLFGRNMTGGAVLVEPAHPDMNEFHAEGAGQYGNYNMVDLTGMVNLPVVKDVFAIRVAGKYRDRDGFTTDVSNGRDYDDQHYYAFRVSAELHLDRFTNYTVFDYMNENEHGSALKLIGWSPTDPVNGNATVIGQQIGASPFFPVAAGAPPQDLASIFTRDVALGHYQVNYGGVGTTVLDGTQGLPFNRIKNWGVTNKTTFEAGDVTFKNIFGYRQIRYTNHTDYDGSEAALILPIQFSNTNDVSEEFQMVGTPFGSRFLLTMGAYYFRESGQDGAYTSTFPQLTSIGFATNIPPLASYFLTQPATFFSQSNIGDGLSRSYAFYAAGTYTLTDSIKLSGGIRYNNDLRRATVNPYYLNLVIPGATPATSIVSPCAFDGLATFSRADCAHTGTLKNDAVTWDATLQYEPNPNFTAYLSTRKGYRAGGFNLRAQDDLTFEPFQPEFVQEYEAGLKNRFELGGGALLDTSVAVYYQDYTNVQKQNIVLVGSQIETVVNNVAAQHDWGAEFEANLRLPGGFAANLFYSYINNKVVAGDNGAYVMQGVPKNQLGGGLTYVSEVPGVGRVSANINATYRSTTPLGAFDAISIQKGYTLVNARAGISNIGGSNFGVAAFVNNLTNTYYQIGGIYLMSNGNGGSSGITPGGGVGLAMASYGEPRTYGVELSFKF